MHFRPTRAWEHGELITNNDITLRNDVYVGNAVGKTLVQKEEVKYLKVRPQMYKLSFKKAQFSSKMYIKIPLSFQ